jgi:RHS repeat-associated protein
VAGGSTTGYTYDANSNRLSAGATTFTYNGADQALTLTKSGTTRDFGYDPAGNQTSSPVSPTTNSSFTYDAHNQPLSGSVPGQPVVTYTYDALGRRASRTTTNTTETYAYVGSLIGRIDRGGGDVTDSAIDALGDRLTVGGAWTLPNVRGDVAGLLNSNQTAITDAYRYDPFGVDLDSQGTSLNPYRFQGRLLEPTSGQYDFGARQYDPAIAAFTSLDTVLGAAQNPLSLNRYLYVWANPEVMIDLDGHRVEQFDSRAEQTAANSTLTFANEPLRRVTSYSPKQPFGALTGIGHLQIICIKQCPEYPIIRDDPMRSFVDLDLTFRSQPVRLGVRLARIDIGRGREGLYRDQLPQLLDALAETTRVESITASSAIEGVVVDPRRIQGLAGEGAEPRRFRNRNEREFAGYRDAMDEISRATELEVLSVPYILHLHRLLFGHTDGGGGRLKTEQNLIVSHARGHREVLFTPPSPRETAFLLPELLERYRQAAIEQAAHPVLLIGALVLDFLAIHPVADGNGRLARLITTHALLDQGYTVSRYASVEQRMFATKDAYYDALYASQRRWHEGEHDVWPWIGYLVDVLAAAYDDFEGRVAARRSLATGSKQDQVRRYILQHAPDVFRIRDVRAALPGISDPTIKRVLADLRREGQIEAADDRLAGRLAAWKRRLADRRSA